MNARLSRLTWLWAALAGLCFLPFLGGVHLFDWDEINFAEAAREMLVTGDYLRVHINFEAFWEKPPLFFWLQALSMKLFGVNDYAARFPNAVCGILTVVVLFRAGEHMHDLPFGRWWALAYLGSVLPHLYFKSGIIDPWFNLFIFSSYTAFSRYRFMQTTGRIGWKKNRWLLWSGLLISLAILTKGPAALIILGICMAVWVIWRRKGPIMRMGPLVVLGLLAVAFTGLWIGIETWKNGTWFLVEFTKYQYRLFSTPDAGHGGFPGYHFVVLLVGCFPASVFALRAFGRLPEQQPFQQEYRLRMKIMFWVVLILFSIAKSKIVHYSSLAYFPLTYLAAETLSALEKGLIPWKKWMTGLLIGICSLFAVALIALPFVMQQVDWLKSLTTDPFAIASFDAEVSWSAWDALPGLVFLLAGAFAIRMIVRREWPLGFVLLFAITAFMVQVGVYTFIGRIEKFSQGAAIDFFESQQGQPVYVATLGYRSYAPWYYSRKPLPDDFLQQAVTRSYALPDLEEFLAPTRPFSAPPRSSNPDWLLQGPIDEEVVFVSKVNKVAKYLEAYPDLEETGRKNGFVFLRRKAVKRGQ